MKAHREGKAVTVRAARTGDLKALLPLFRGYLRFYRVRAAERTARRFLGERLRNRDAVIFLAACGGRPAGFVTIYPSFCSLAQRPIWILYDLFVQPRLRRTGIGRTLMETAGRFAASTGAERIELSTAFTNRSAQKLYESLGYRRDRRFAHYALLLSKPA